MKTYRFTVNDDLQIVMDGRFLDAELTAALIAQANAFHDMQQAFSEKQREKAAEAAQTLREMSERDQ